ncbi:MAG: bifunctional glutamate N-acetyltransferase/amino-acid acetyltransferase ArgJ [Clostridiales bacterium]|nr:bifunctional glutamate N-acetyltransferase/amino-acid acetyltransferase ArgJ [Candidatus Crickella merdequi]
MKYIDGGVTAAKGFEAAATAAGIKYKDRTDMAMIYSAEPCVAAGTFTTNVCKAAPVIWDKQICDSGAAVHAVVVNSGIANACTGQEGLDICQGTADAAAEALSIPADSVVLGSTGVIGKQIPLDKIAAGVKVLAGEKCSCIEAGSKAAAAIMTTDTCPKELAVTIEVDGVTVTIGGMAKGSGMIHPNMCTMLAFITTDAVITKEALQSALSDDVNDTYNMISVDGDTSTNDTVLVLANGQAGNPVIECGTPAYEEFKKALHEINEYLAKKIAGDGEGATALFTVIAKGCESVEQAKLLAKSIACSNLVKTAIAGHDANWGRILCAMGYSGAQFDPVKVDLSFESAAGQIQICENGTAVDYSEDKATEILSESEITATVDVHMGDCQATAWGCDLTHAYIEINADYRS